MTLKALLAGSALAAGLATMAAAPAGASVYIFSYAGDGINASGLITLSDTPESASYPGCPSCNTSDGYQVLSIVGERNGQAITGLTSYSGDTQEVYLSNPNLDWGGLAYVAGGVQYNVYYAAFGIGSYSPPVAHLGYGECTGPAGCNTSNDAMLSRFTLQPALPEPATWALMLIGFGGVGGAVRSARRKAIPVT